MPEANEIHVPVLLRQTLEMLNAGAGGVFIDATLGLGGHTEAILDANLENIVIGMDRDGDAISYAVNRLRRFGKRFRPSHANFSDISTVAYREGATSTDGIMADLGVSSLQFDSPERGFSFRFDSPLDMRMDTSSGGETAAELLERLDEEEIANIIYEYGEERFSRRIAKRIVEKRELGEPVETTGELARLVERAVVRSRKDKIHPATRTFQALRIAVNDELGVLDGFLRDSIDLLKLNGRMVVITFHSLEDRIVKQVFQKLSGKCFCPPRIPQCVCGAVRRVEVLTKKPIVPDEEEMSANPRARSAKLRAVRKI